MSINQETQSVGFSPSIQQETFLSVFTVTWSQIGKMKTTEDGRYECDFRSSNTHQNIHYESYILYKPITGDSEENGRQCEFLSAVESVQERIRGNRGRILAG